MSGDGFSRRIRPYLLTGGRTQCAVELPVETQIRAASGAGQANDLEAERRRIVELCQEPTAVAEVAARAGLHLQVTKILIEDLINDGHLSAGDTAINTDRPDLGLLEQVLNGLQAL
ncbi:MAG: DUF742 domain-containing protein [Actinomycetota bacterium]